MINWTKYISIDKWRGLTKNHLKLHWFGLIFKCIGLFFVSVLNTRLDMRMCWQIDDSFCWIYSFRRSTQFDGNQSSYYLDAIDGIVFIRSIIRFLNMISLNLCLCFGQLGKPLYHNKGKRQMRTFSCNLG